MVNSQFTLNSIFTGVVYKAVEVATDELVALKKLKLERERNGFPMTSLREINMLMKCRMHPNIVALKVFFLSIEINAAFSGDCRRSQT